MDPKFAKQALVISLLLFQSSCLAAENLLAVEVEKFWANLAATLSKGDYEAYRSAHHPDAVLVVNGKSQSMKRAHKSFQRGFDDTAAGTVKAGIEFLWTQRSIDSDTAFQKGAFRYWSEAAGSSYDQYTRFEAILVKAGGEWKLLVQKQYKTLTKEEWNALAKMQKEDN